MVAKHSEHHHHHFLYLKQYVRASVRPSVAHSTSYFSATKGRRDLRFAELDRRHAPHSAVKGQFVVGQIGAELEVK